MENKTDKLALRLKRIQFVFSQIGQIFSEIGKGFLRQDEVLFRFMLSAIAILIGIMLEWDIVLFKKLNLWSFYPADGWVFRVYVPLMIFMPFLFFGVWMRNSKKKFQKKLKEVFDLVGLKNAIGGYPNFLSLEPLTGGSMKLRLTNGAFTINEWLKCKNGLEANMKVFIDEIKSVQEKGIIEITFSYDPMPTKVSIENIQGYRDYQYLIGRDRMKSYVGNFSDSPHLLVGGESGGGKSAFMRQLVTTIKLNQPEAEFHIIDLKKVDFTHFAKFPNMMVIEDIDNVSTTLKNVTTKLKMRSDALKERGLTKIDDFFATDEYKKMSVEKRSEHILGRRIFVVVDECAEIFLFGLGNSASSTREIRGCMSTITRLGRFVGIHVVLGTQRPDKQAIDPQVKSNLTSTICYRIQDIGGSLTILGNGRANDLPGIKGRAILKNGSNEHEVQTPWMEFKDSNECLEDLFKISPEQEMISNVGSVNVHTESKQDNPQT